MTALSISDRFDSGNIEVVDASDPSHVRLRIRPDAGGDHFQWFHFRIAGARGRPLMLHIENAQAASYPSGWTEYQACYSSDRRTWRRVMDTRFVEGELQIQFTPESDVVYLAYFAPYSWEQHLDLLARALRHPDVRLHRLGSSVEGRDLDALRIASPDGAEQRPQLWVIARQHPGESMAEWLVEGLLDRLLDDGDPVAARLRQHAVWHIVPNMNPDGSVRGHLRNNAAGKNLNRVWADPSEDTSPEVHAVRRAMESGGVDFFLDVHGDEALPHNFVAGAEGTPSWNEAKTERQARFSAALMEASPDFQVEKGYPKAGPGQANMGMATNWVGERFGCLALTLEQPFKDALERPRPEGWSPARARALGRAVLEALWRTRSDWMGR